MSRDTVVVTASAANEKSAFRTAILATVAALGSIAAALADGSWAQAGIAVGAAVGAWALVKTAPPSVRLKDLPPQIEVVDLDGEPVPVKGRRIR